MPMRRPLLICMSLALTAPVRARQRQLNRESPAGTEYQLPIDRAREQASGGSQDAGTSGEAPLFGAGVPEKPRSMSTKSGSDSDPATSAVVESDPGTRQPQTMRPQVPALDGGARDRIASAGAAFGVLLLGGLAGLAWRRRTTRG